MCNVSGDFFWRGREVKSQVERVRSPMHHRKTRYKCLNKWLLVLRVRSLGPDLIKITVWFCTHITVRYTAYRSSTHGGLSVLSTALKLLLR